MLILFFFAAVAAPACIFFLSRRVKPLREAQASPLSVLTVGKWPDVGLIIPAAGNHPDMEAAIRSLLSQSYPGRVRAVVVTAVADEPAAYLAQHLRSEFPTLTHVVAGYAGNCGQKNHNSLAGVKFLGDSVKIYAFCDSTHVAAPDFLRRLVTPLAFGEDVFSTGYHEVVPDDDAPVTLAYTFCVVCMRLLQSSVRPTEPWGGAMAISRASFRAQGIDTFWANNVVDDCSLTTFLAKRGIRVRLCPGALLRTRSAHHEYAVWKAWLERQILFLKFCVPGQWRLLGVLSLAVVMPPLFTLLTAVALCFGLATFSMMALSGIYLVSSLLATARLRPLVARHVRMSRWFSAFVLTSVMFFFSYLRTVPAKGILWHDIWYEVGTGGRVVSMHHHA